jgi:hypothetical protein
MTIFELKALSRKITSLLAQNDWVLDDDIKALQKQYETEMKKREVKSDG